MDEVVVNNLNTNSNSNSSNEAFQLNSSNYYENALRKLSHIFRTKNGESVKQLEDLWESVNSLHANQKTGETIASRPASPLSDQGTKRDISKVSSSSNLTTLSKKPKVTTNSNLPKSNTNNNASSLSKNVSSSKIKDMNKNTETQQITVFSSLNTQSSGNNDSSTNIKFDDINSVVDMLDFSCSMCNQFNQESNNKLIECRQCTKLFHQQCHSPKIDDTQISSDHETVSNNSKQLVWYISQCENCTQVKKSSSVSPTNDTENSSKTQKPTTLTQVSKNSSTNVVKGLAALATKLNTTTSSSSKLQNTTNTNNDDLFKKFKQTANTTTITTTTTNNNSNSTKKPASTTNTTSSPPSNPTISCSLSSAATNKSKNIFNINSSVKPNLVVSSVKK